MLAKLQEKALAILAVVTAVTACLMAFQVMSPEVGAAIDGLVASLIIVVRSFVSPVAKTAVLLDKTVEQANDLLGKVKL